MYAITVPSPGGPESLTWAQVPDPVPAEGEVLVEVAASAVNRADLLQRQGAYPPPPGASPYLGLECSGRVAALGPGATGWQVGDEVCGLLAGGGYAELVTAPAVQLLPVPAGLSVVDAAALPEVACTVWSNLVMIGHLGPGESVLVHGGASGIGTFAIQLGRWLGAQVFCTVGTEEKRRRCLELGADVAIDYRQEDFVAQVRAETSGRGVDVILDNMGGGYLARNVDVLARCGRLLVIGLQGGQQGELNLSTLLGKCASVTATALRSRPVAEKAEIIGSLRANLWPAIEAGEIQPIVDRVLPLHDAAQAHRVVEAGEHVGKVVLAR